MHIEDSDSDERSWHFISLDAEVLLLANWYRSPSSEDNELLSFREELSKHAPEATGLIIVGDLNIHHTRWLRFSNGNTHAGSVLKAVCDSYNLNQYVRAPTRHEYLLDLFLSDVPGIKLSIEPAVADHSAIFAKVKVPEISSKEIPQFAFRLKDAKWTELRTALEQVDWRVLQRGSAEEAFTHFMDTLWLHLCKYIPYAKRKMKKQSHPWLNDRCREAIARKNDKEDRDDDEYRDAAKSCAEVLADEYQRYVLKLKEEIAQLPKGSKKWWKLNRQLLEKKAKMSGIPPLKNEEGWIHDPKLKADLFAKVFASKAQLPPEEVDCPYFGEPETEIESRVILRTRYTLKLLQSLDVGKATGPDRIPASILKTLADVIALPFTMICRRLLKEACWPEFGKNYKICSPYKKKSASRAENYRGVHLTAILSKIAERVIGRDLISFLQSGKFGTHQWAYSKGLSSRDLVTALVMSWTLAICQNKKIAAYLSDISGAFDRVCKEYLLAKLHAAGVGTEYLNFLDKYLDPRQARVIVDGAASDPFVISNTVFQGTVLGPPLWNTFFADVICPATSTGGEGKAFADDLNVFQAFETSESAAVMQEDMDKCRQRVHKWGRRNRVKFDAQKEHIIIIHPIQADGDSFKLLGCLVDCKLLMDQAIEEILAQARPKIRAILRTRAYYDRQILVAQFKTHGWGILEIHNGAIFHASKTHLDKIDGLHRNFLNELGISQQQAFFDFNFAPPMLRRQIGILGLLHKRVLGSAHPVFQELLPFHGDVFGELRPREHNKQLYGHFMAITRQRALFDRSIFSMVDVYNKLPQSFVDVDDIKIFQAKLTARARLACELDDENWTDISKLVLADFIARHQ